MKKNHSLTFVVLLILCSVFVSANTRQDRQIDTTPSEHQSIPRDLLFYLSTLGKEHDVFFTIEETWKLGETDEIRNNRVELSSERKPLQQELEYVRKSVPHLAYIINRTNPRIIHILDMRLMQQKGYGLESVIQSIDFTGKVNDLVVAIGELGVPVSPPFYRTVHGPGSTRDYTTVIHVSGKGLKVRDALSLFVPLERRVGKILWIARTERAGRKITDIYYPSQLLRPDAEPGT